MGGGGSGQVPTGSTRVAPVVAVPLGGTGYPYVLPPGARRDPPTFDGTRNKVGEFINRWPVYLQSLKDNYTGINNAQLLEALDGSLDPASRDELQRLKEAGENIRYEDFWQWDTQTIARDEWN